MSVLSGFAKLIHNKNQVNLVLAHFATDWCYAQTLKDRAKFSVVHPATPTENQKVKAPDRIRIIEALKNAGYDVDRLARGGSPMVF
jgi:hypothetical protein